MTHILEIHPRDILFFRDARPMSGGDIGSGAAWPLPHVFHSAIMTAFHDAWPESQAWERRHSHVRGRHDKNFSASALRFGGLKTAGPFPCIGGNPLFPTPADLVLGGVMRPIKAPREAISNLRCPLAYPVASGAVPSKESIGEWLPSQELEKYLQGEASVGTVQSSMLFDSEPRPGVGIDPETRANMKSLFYQAEYLRLAQNVSMTAFAEFTDAKTRVDAVSELFKTGSRLVRFGGQSGLATVGHRGNGAIVPAMPQELVRGTTRVKWVLLAPAVFVSGWLPGWVDKKSAQVLLEPEVNGVRTKIPARLVAARIPKPIHFSGWRLDKDKDHSGGGPDRTYLAVPAGSVYYFEAESPEAAFNLAAALHGRRRSDLLGEQGYGLGVCGSWEFYNNL